MNTKSRTLAAFSLLLMLSLTLAPFASIRADAPPGNPYSVYGYVTLNGQPAPAGVTIIVWITDRFDCSTLTNAKGQYTVDFDAIQGEIANFTVYVYDKYVEPLDNQSVQITDPSPHGYFINLSVNVSQNQNENTEGGGGGGETTQNLPPVADASAGEPYQGFVNQNITFDGSKSHDPDGHIIAWAWSFGDGTSGTGEHARHKYTQVGTYKVTLTVTDNQSLTGSVKTTATILQANNPPTTPVITGGPGVSGHMNISYDIQVTSTDADNDMIHYIIGWGDGKTSTTQAFASEVAVTQAHMWASAGRFVITAKASDNTTESGAASVAVLIDAMYVDGYGYLVDTNGDGIYDKFYSNATGSFTAVKLQADGTYLIDTNGDGTYDYVFNPTTKQLTTYTLLTIPESQNGLMILGGIIGVILILLVVLLLLTRRKKPGDTSASTEGTNPGNPGMDPAPSKASTTKKPRKPAK